MVTLAPSAELSEASLSVVPPSFALLSAALLSEGPGPSAPPLSVAPPSPPEVSAAPSSPPLSPPLLSPPSSAALPSVPPSTESPLPTTPMPKIVSPLPGCGAHKGCGPAGRGGQPCGSDYPSNEYTAFDSGLNHVTICLGG